MLQSTPAKSLGSRRHMFDELYEKKLAEYIGELDDLFYGSKRQEVMRLAYEYARLNDLEHHLNVSRKTAEKKWFVNFCRRNNFSLRAPEKMFCCRASGFNKTAVNGFLKILNSITRNTTLPVIVRTIWMNLAFQMFQRKKLHQQKRRRLFPKL